MDTKLEKHILNLTNSDRIINSELVQRLWSDYGKIERVTTNNSSYIIKLIEFPVKADHPKGWNTAFSHERKKKSYQVESHWYQNFNDKIDGAYSPRLIGSGHLTNKGTFLILEDLTNSDFHSIESIEWSEVKRCLKWLAKFHRHYLGIKQNNLWAQGTYWHLETRPDELDRLTDIKLKEAAPKIDKILNEASFKTIVHGDAKLANFLFNQTEVAAVDFQYVGGGIGVKDIAYFLSSVYDGEELEKNESLCLDYYFKELANKEVEREWRRLYPVAWCDFYRFLKGWAPEHYKINTYSEKMRNKVLEWI